MRRLHMVLLVNSIALLGSQQASSAAPITTHYAVSGSTVDELISDMNATGPDGGWGKTNLDWVSNYTWENVGGQFKVKTAPVTQTITIIMPSWAGYKSTTKCMKASWDKMYKSLENHEKQHIKLGQGVDKLVKDAVLAVPAQPSEAELDTAVDEAVKEVAANHKKVQAKFDNDTDHGKSDPNDPVIFNACP